MALCVPLSSTDPDEMATVMRPIDGSLVVMERGVFSANATWIDLNRLWMQHVEETLPRIWHVGLPSDRAVIWFLTRPGPTVAFQGADVGANDISLCSIGEPVWQRLTGASSWGSMSLSLEDWAGLATVAGRDLFSSRASMILTPNASDVARLQRLHRATARMACDAPELLDNADVARGIEQSLIHAMVECLQPSAMASADVPLPRRSKIMRRLRDVLDDCGDEPLYVPELCAKLGVASRTLRTICHEYLGMGPKKYLYLRRMHLVRRALRAGNADEATVTEIAMQFGFWELGRFAVEYRTLFGESPSVTLRHKPT